MSTQSMKPATAAKKLGIHLPATPPEFQEGTVTRTELATLQSDPPAWLVQLRQEGPHPRAEVARKLGVSNSGLARAGVPDSMTTAEIKALLAEMPEWLVTERKTQADVRAANAKLNEAKKA